MPPLSYDTVQYAFANQLITSVERLWGAFFESLRKRFGVVFACDSKRREDFARHYSNCCKWIGIALVFSSKYWRALEDATRIITQADRGCLCICLEALHDFRGRYSNYYASRSKLFSYLFGSIGVVQGALLGLLRNGIEVVIVFVWKYCSTFGDVTWIITQVDWGCLRTCLEVLEDFRGRYSDSYGRVSGLFSSLCGSVGGLDETLFVFLRKWVGIVAAAGSDCWRT